MSETTEIWTYKSRSIMGSKLVTVFIKPDGVEYVAARSPFPRWAKPGATFKMTFEDEKYYVKGPKGPEFAGWIESKDLRTEWELVDAAVAAKFKSSDVAKNEKLLLERRLAPIRREYKRLWMVPDSQAAILAAVIREITH